MQTIDITADYMSIICDYVTKDNQDVYKVIYDDYIKFTKTSEFLNDGFDAGLWAYDRYALMNEDFKTKVIMRYGIVKLMNSLEYIAGICCCESVSEFLKEYDSVEEALIVHIINDEVLMNF